MIDVFVSDEDRDTTTRTVDLIVAVRGVVRLFVNYALLCNC